jgi:hypothetical protein
MQGAFRGVAKGEIEIVTTTDNKRRLHQILYTMGAIRCGRKISFKRN